MRSTSFASVVCVPRSAAVLLPLVALMFTPALASAYEDCGNGYYCDGDLVCNSSNTGCLPAGATECGTGYCDAGETCCADGCGTDGCGTTDPGSSSCAYTNDGECDEGTYCDYGTDTADCSGGGGSSDNSCQYAYDGECDEGTYCDSGTDSADCGGSTNSDGYTCASEALEYDGGSCSVDFCATSDFSSCYYEVNGSTVTCADCSNISSCAQEAADICVDGGGSDDGGNDSCQWAYDGECDEGTYCPYGTDTSDCDGGGCSIAEQPGSPSSFSAAWPTLAGLMMLLGFAARRRSAAARS